MNSQRLEQLMGFLKASPKEPFLLFAIAKEYEGLNDQDNALKYYLELEHHAPDYIGTYYHLGKLYEQLGQDAKAFFTYKKGMQKAREAGDTHSLSELAGAKLELGDDDDFED
ncbi:tetratricopeptide repeat protein [Aureispira sp. CCB-E]|uniref:tetratricopeptide repeat protein n=1 Tax=Aureispira sp. CCB-E TaxID=3051121 RepID=UPI0028689CE2|nr:tetratricopeptide repeat protein [Aureispira sp. CCB-E]WMX16728.1 tetratricopeptide repeat protein [Aureispira sp. CCB-E]